MSFKPKSEPDIPRAPQKVSNLETYSSSDNIKSGSQKRFGIPIRYLRTISQIVLLLLLNFTIIGSLYISSVLPILRFPKFWDLPGFSQEDVPLCTGGSLLRTMSGFWPFILIILIIGVLILVCILIGRALCGWACPIGFIQDLVSRFLRRLKINAFEPSRKVHHKMKFIKFALLFVIIALAASFGIAILINAPMGDLYQGLFDPMAQASPICLGCPTPVMRYIFIDIGYNMNPNLDNPSNVFQLSIFLFFIVGIFAIPRFWCRYFCPVGAMSSMFNKVSLLHLSKDQARCTKCNYCVDVCPTRVESVKDESEFARLGDTSCTLCAECVEKCPDKALAIKFGSYEIYRGGKHWWEKKNKKNN
jgi:polyferredoxin